jgi:hypothetical protein
MISFSQVYKRYPGGHEALKNLPFSGEAAKNCRRRQAVPNQALQPDRVKHE